MAIKAKSKIADELGVDETELEAAKDVYADEQPDTAIVIDIDFDGGNLQEYAKGTYHARLEATEKKVAQSGNTMIVWRFRTLEDKRAWWLNTVLTRDAMWKVTETAVACGAKGDGMARVDVSKLIGNCCRLVIDHQTYEGETRPYVKKVLPPTEATHDLNDLG